MGMLGPNIARLKKKGNVAALAKALAHPRRGAIRVKAAAALGELRDSRAVEHLVKALKDDTVALAEFDVALHVDFQRHVLRLNRGSAES